MFVSFETDLLYPIQQPVKLNDLKPLLAKIAAELHEQEADRYMGAMFVLRTLLVHSDIHILAATNENATTRVVLLVCKSTWRLYRSRTTLSMKP